MPKKKILILGTTGMLGHAMFQDYINNHPEFEVYGTCRDKRGLDQYFSDTSLERIIGNVEAENIDSVIKVIGQVKPRVVINCIGVIKQLDSANDPLTAIPVNSLFPHRLAALCKAAGARLIHISTDCVFDGRKGSYTEEDISNATDIYGRTKFLGEVYYDHCITLRTSIIGHELKSKYGLVEWFLSQTGTVNGYSNVIYTGFPTVELSAIIANYVIPEFDLSGLYQVSSDPVNKYELLKLIAETYGKQIDIIPYPDIVLDRSLNSEKFRKVTGYYPPPWKELVKRMCDDFSGIL